MVEIGSEESGGESGLRDWVGEEGVIGRRGSRPKRSSRVEFMGRAL